MVFFVVGRPLVRREEKKKNKMKLQSLVLCLLSSLIATNGNVQIYTFEEAHVC